ncbi:peroxidase 5-like [Typha angustifolia]|uniref:peroxidase 5-like n=1 Tax=Typha angustifolia TaxID=59011 RepID=UPI003C2F8D54
MGLRKEVLLAFLVVFCLSSREIEGQIVIRIRIGFYFGTCPQAELIVRDEVRRSIANNAGVAPGLIRMHFHDCFVRGCDGSVLIDSTASNSAEKDSPINTSLFGFEVIDRAKARLEAACPGVVSCADILAFAARDSVALTGGFNYQVPSGRRDGRVSLASETFGNLPPPSFNLDQLTQSFAAKGLSQDEMITLSGAHTVGVSQCNSFSSRLYSFNSTVSQDPSLDPTYAIQLKQQCPQNSNGVVPMDPRSPNTFDSSYYSSILVNRGLFTSDQTLASTAATAAKVRENASNEARWKSKFAAAMVKMGQIGMLTGSNGEIRSNCRVIN